jgi:predicted acetyltransferase
MHAGRLEIQELVALSRNAYLALWRYCAEVDLVATVEAGMRSVDEPLTWHLENARPAFQQTARTDFLWLRPMDVARFLAARRYACDGRLVLEVADPLGLCGGRFVLDGGPEGATCRPTEESADLRVDVAALGAVSLGGVSLRALHWAGLVTEETPKGIQAGERLLRWPVTPWCSTHF